MKVRHPNVTYFHLSIKIDLLGCFSTLFFHRRRTISQQININLSSNLMENILFHEVHREMSFFIYQNNSLKYHISSPKQSNFFFWFALKIIYRTSVVFCLIFFRSFQHSFCAGGRWIAITCWIIRSFADGNVFDCSVIDK